MNYRIDQPWQTQINPTTVATIRSLAGSHYDLVERNNHRASTLFYDVY
ncbi:inverse autotransporter beta domain-containing protein [Candidatus Regiella insecticola]